MAAQGGGHAGQVGLGLQREGEGHPRLEIRQAGRQAGTEGKDQGIGFDGGIAGLADVSYLSLELHSSPEGQPGAGGGLFQNEFRTGGSAGGRAEGGREEDGGVFGAFLIEAERKGFLIGGGTLELPGHRGDVRVAIGIEPEAGIAGVADQLSLHDLEAGGVALVGAGLDAEEVGVDGGEGFAAGLRDGFDLAGEGGQALDLAPGQGGQKVKRIDGAVDFDGVNGPGPAADPLMDVFDSGDDFRPGSRGGLGTETAG
ncbi:MAG: hypothetical protein BWY71_02312 [Planctomycetes bacterium ADurb.Bin412]|nr:MAG: hypothetical protein BWY71_02312 [Planctomycetes bacterium ADurb.Bin412]